MPSSPQTLANPDQTLPRLLAAAIGESKAHLALTTLTIDPALAGTGDTVSRAQVAMALNAALFADLLDRVPTAQRYIDAVRGAGETIVFDHGAPSMARPATCPAATWPSAASWPRSVMKSWASTRCPS